MGSPAVYEFADAGRVTFCDGTFYVNLEAAADLSFLSFNGDPSTTILDGASSGSILLVDTDALSINVYDLTLQNGYGSGLVANYYDYDETGGAISCEASSEINLDNVHGKLLDLGRLCHERQRGGRGCGAALW